MPEPITAVPEIYLRLESGGVHQVMFVNPNEDLATEPPAGTSYPNTLRVYHTARPGILPVVHLLDVPLPVVLGNQPTELTYTPNAIGAFFYSWAYSDPTTTPTPTLIEGPLTSFPVEIVYGRASTIRRIVENQGCVGEEEADTSELLAIISRASRMFEEYTDQFFHPKYASLMVEGKDAGDLLLPVPIIEIFDVRTSGTGEIVQPSLYRVFNRHIAARNKYVATSPTKPDGFIEGLGDGTGGITSGQQDDRRNPRISFRFPNEYTKGGLHARSGDTFLGSGLTIDDGEVFYGPLWRRGRHNYQVTGFFGFTNPDLSTPAPVSFCIERLALREYTFLFGSEDDVERVVRAHEVTLDRTDTHWIQYEKNRRLSQFTGDPTVDQWIGAFSRVVGGGNI